MTPLSTPVGLTDATPIITTDNSFMGMVTALNNALGVADEHDFSIADEVHHALGSGRMYVDDFTRLLPAIVPPVGFEAGRVALELDTAGGGLYSGRHFLHTGGVWTSWKSNRIQYARETGAVIIPLTTGLAGWDDWDAANLDLAIDMCDGVTRPDELEWAYRCRFQGSFTSDTPGLLEVRIFNNTDGEPVAYSQVEVGVGLEVNIALDTIYQPAAGGDAQRDLKVQVRTSAGGWALSRTLDAGLGTGVHTHEVSEIAV